MTGRSFRGSKLRFLGVFNASGASVPAVPRVFSCTFTSTMAVRALLPLRLLRA